MTSKLELLAKEIEQHVTEDSCACCRTIKEILETGDSP